MINSQAVLVANNVAKTYRKPGSPPIQVLRRVDLEILPADSVAILGKSGTGKSTLLHILGTLDAPTSGDVYFRGQSVFRFREKRLAAFRNRELGFVFQFHYLMLEFTALENVMMPILLSGGTRSVARKRALALLDRVGLSERLGHKPGELSGGEQQRVAIARALAMKPRLLLTDEMTGNLDPVTGRQVFELIQELHQEMQMAIVSVTHDEQLASAYSRLYRLEEGVLKPHPKIETY